MPPAYVKPYVRCHKNDAVDAEAICEAVTRANMRFVATKTPEQQSASVQPWRLLWLPASLIRWLSVRRDFSAWIGLVPRQNSSGGKNRLGNISKRGDRYLRSLFTTGALAVIRYAKIHGTKHRPWLTALLTRRPTKVAAIALANKIARMAWAMMAKGERYKEPAALAA
jgi:transposase